MDKKVNFVKAAIDDAQATIRAIDVKIGALLIIVLAPLQNLHRIFAHLNHFAKFEPSWLTTITAGAFVIAWVASLAVLVRGLAAIDNPAAHIINAGNCKGSYYAGGMYPLTLADAFFNRDLIRASKDPTTFAQNLPASEPEMELELVFEHMKLAYIRDVKLKRLYWGVRFAEVWLTLGVLIYIISKYWTTAQPVQ